MAASQRPPWKHHYVPRLLLRRFARDGKVLSRISRAGKATGATPDSVCWKGDFHTLEGEGHPDPVWIERYLGSNVEEPANVALKSITGPDGFPPAEPHRRVLARFVAWQLLRGPDARALANTVPRFIFDVGARFVSRARATEMLNELGLPVDAMTGELRKNPLLDLLGRTADHVTGSIGEMHLTLVRFPERSLITSDRPVVVWDKITRDHPPYGVGVGLPHILSLHLDPHHALLLTPPEVVDDDTPERVVDGSPENAKILNWRTAQWAWDQVFHHPDHTPLPAEPLPPRASFDEMLIREIDERLGERPWHVRKIGRWLLKR